ncbi:MAG: alpha/beta fold hydrolase [Gammaproteobacteria bacterium]|nr:alpha/beta fold hydrolase [Gammaproteobacteria bacterium]
MKKFKITIGLSFLLGLVSCVQVPKTIQLDKSISFTKIDGYKFHTETFGDSEKSKVIVVHGGPGGDFEYLNSLKSLSNNHQVIFYDQRGSGLSPRVDKGSLTLEQNLDDLHSVVKHYSKNEKVKLIGHSWGGMLVVGYLSKHPEKVSQAIIVEPGMLNQKSAIAFVDTMQETQSFSDILTLIKYILVYPFVKKEDGHEGFDYVMTKMLNQNKPGKPYQCEGQVMPENVFKRGGYEAFSNMLKPVMDAPTLFTHDLANNISDYHGDLMLISSECSSFGYEFQKKHHMPLLPRQTVHIEAKNMGHNMLTLNPDWSLKTVRSLFNG